LGKKFGTEKSSSFINGILDKIAHSEKQKWIFVPHFIHPLLFFRTFFIVKESIWKIVNFSLF
jgi:hypothetical protein